MSQKNISTPFGIVGIGIAILILIACYRVLPDIAWRVFCSPCVDAYVSLKHYYLQTYWVSVWFFSLMLGLLLLERFKPARPQQKVFSKSLAYDGAWTFLHGTFRVFMILPIWVLLEAIHSSNLSFLILPWPEQTPLAVKLIVVILASDFLAWFSHLLRHKVPYFWSFHKLHHSAQELNIFTGYRVHPIDRVISRLITFIPLFSLQPNIALPAMFIWNYYINFHSRLFHSNIATNLGPLRYIFTTPQSHRVHHSREPVHHDKNFGAVFSIWDHLFGTQHQDYDDYPETGIRDVKFPMEHGQSLISQPVTMVKQLLFPFTDIARQKTRVVIQPNKNNTYRDSEDR